MKQQSLRSWPPLILILLARRAIFGFVLLALVFGLMLALGPPIQDLGCFG